MLAEEICVVNGEFDAPKFNFDMSHYYSLKQASLEYLRQNHLGLPSAMIIPIIIWYLSNRGLLLVLLHCMFVFKCLQCMC